MDRFWHLRDLWTSDNRGLGGPAEDGPPLPVFVLAVLDYAECREVALETFEAARGE